MNKNRSDSHKILRQNLLWIMKLCTIKNLITGFLLKAFSMFKTVALLKFKNLDSTDQKVFKDFTL